MVVEFLEGIGEGVEVVAVALVVDRFLVHGLLVLEELRVGVGWTWEPVGGEVWSVGGMGGVFGPAVVAVVAALGAGLFALVEDGGGHGAPRVGGFGMPVQVPTWGWRRRW